MAEDIVGFNALFDNTSVSADVGIEDGTNGILAADSSFSDVTTSPYASEESHQN